MITNNSAQIIVCKHQIDTKNRKPGSFQITTLAETDWCHILSAGTGPIIVTKENGTIHEFGPHTNIETAVKLTRDKVDAGSKQWCLTISLDQATVDIDKIKTYFGLNSSDIIRLRRNNGIKITAEKIVLEASLHMFKKLGLLSSIDLYDGEFDYTIDIPAESSLNFSYEIEAWNKYKRVV